MQRIRLALVIGATCLVPATALANPYDISLRGLGRPKSQSLTDAAVLRYEKLSSELAFALAPRPLEPAETLGMSGFEFSLASTTSDISESEDYWQGQAGEPVFEGVLPSHGARKVPSSFWLPTAHLRKGLPLSSEIGVSASYLAYSEMFNLGAEFKIALHESYFRWAPALSARFAFGRLFGSSDLDMITGEWDVMTSLPFGVGGMAQLTPFAGGGVLYAHVNSQVIDETPYSVLDPSDQKGGADGSLYTFPTLDWKSNHYARAFGGIRLNVAMMELMYVFDVGLSVAGKSLQAHTIKLGFDV